MCNTKASLAIEVRAYTLRCNVHYDKIQNMNIDMQRYNYYEAYYKAAELLHKEFCENNNLDILVPRNYMYALALELSLKDLLCSQKEFSVEHQHHNIGKLLKVVALKKELLDKEKPWVKNLLQKDDLLEKLSNIIYWSGKYYLPKCPKNKIIVIIRDFLENNYQIREAPLIIISEGVK